MSLYRFAGHKSHNVNKWVLRPYFSDTTDIYFASRVGDLDRVRQLVEKEGVNVNKRDFWDSVPLYHASLCGHVEVVKYLLGHGAVCSENTFDGDRCLYGALTLEIRDILLNGEVTKVPPLKPLAASLRKLCALCDDPEQLVSQRFLFCSDLELVYGNVSYRLNKVLLAARMTFFDEKLQDNDRDRIELDGDEENLPSFEALLFYVYCDKIDIDMKKVGQLRQLAQHYGTSALVKTTEKELRSIKYVFKSLKKRSAPRRFILYPFSFPEDATLEYDLSRMYDRSRSLDVWMSKPALRDANCKNDYADAVIKIGMSLFRVHLCILCTRSEFFEQLVFSSGHDFEALPRMECPLFGGSLMVLPIADVSHQTLRHLLEYLYTDQIASLVGADLLDVESLSQLFEVCNRFLVFGAKRVVAERIRSCSMTMRQTCQLSITADFYDVPQLRDDCLRRLAAHLDNILDENSRSGYLGDFAAFVVAAAPEGFTDAESLFDSLSKKRKFRGVIDGNAVTGIGRNSILDDLREKYLELYGRKGKNRDIDAGDFGSRFLKFAADAMNGVCTQPPTAASNAASSIRGTDSRGSRG